MDLNGQIMHRVRIGGKLSFNSLPKATQEAIKKRLSEKDDIISRGLKGELSGIKINGKPVTKDSIKDLEIEVEGQKPSKSKKKWKLEDLKNMPFLKLKEIGKGLGTTDRSKKNLISEILSLQ